LCQHTLVSATVVRATSCAFAFISAAWRGTVGPSCNIRSPSHAIVTYQTHIELVLAGYSTLLRNLSALCGLRRRIVWAGRLGLGRLLRHAATIRIDEILGSRCDARWDASRSRGAPHQTGARWSRTVTSDGAGSNYPAPTATRWASSLRRAVT